MRHQQLRNATLLFIGTALLLASSPGMAQAPRRSAEELLEAMQGTWVRDSMNNKGDWIRREKVIQGNTETITDYDKDNQTIRGWTVQFKVERFAGKYNVFRTSGVVYIFDVDDNYWYELHDLKRTKTMLPAFRRVKPTGNLNENTLKGIENWIGKWRGDFVPTAVAGYGNVAGEPLQVDFTVEKNSLGTTLVFSWIESKKSSGEVVGTVHGYAAWSPAKKDPRHPLHQFQWRQRQGNTLSSGEGLCSSPRWYGCRGYLFGDLHHGIPRCRHPCPQDHQPCPQWPERSRRGAGDAQAGPRVSAISAHLAVPDGVPAMT